MVSSKEDSKPSPTLIDALFNYAIDPIQFEALGNELDKNIDSLSGSNPTSFLSALGHAEALAWQMRTESETDQGRQNCTYYLLDQAGNVAHFNETLAEIDAYCRIDDKRLVFSSTVSTQAFNKALDSVQANSGQHALVELSSESHPIRFGYLVRASDLPASLSHASDDIAFGFLIAQAEPTKQAQQVLQSSFQLTAAEKTICMHLSMGMQLKDIADTLNISTNTARNHLQSVFDKTGINRQGDLILLMTQLNFVLSLIHPNEVTNGHPPLEYPDYKFFLVPSGSRKRSPGRRMAYREYGEGSRVVFYLHETCGTSRLPPGTESLANENDLRLIAIDRPGTGFSDPATDYEFGTAANDLDLLMTELNISEASLIGYMGGAAHALVSAATLRKRIKHIMLIAGRGPEPFSKAEKSPVGKLRRRLSQQPWLLSSFFNILRSRASTANNRKILLRLYGAVPHDREFLEAHPDILDHIVGYTLEALTVSSQGVVGEVACFSEPIQTDLTEITASVTIWHGDHDVVANYDQLVESLRGLQYEERIFKDAGSMIVYEHWPEAINQVAQVV